MGGAAVNLDPQLSELGIKEPEEMESGSDRKNRRQSRKSKVGAGLDAINEEQEDDQSYSSDATEEEPDQIQKENAGSFTENLKDILSILKRFVSRVLGILFNSDILHIIRPFIYVFLVMKHGKTSWVPIQISLALDLLIIFLVFLKLIGAQKLRTIERRDLTRRNIISLLKYFLRDPLFETFTLKVLHKIFSVLRIPEALFGILLSVLNYYRYYIYIA